MEARYECSVKSWTRFRGLALKTWSMCTLHASMYFINPRRSRSDVSVTSAKDDCRPMMCWPDSCKQQSPLSRRSSSAEVWVLHTSTKANALIERMSISEIQI